MRVINIENDYPFDAWQQYCMFVKDNYPHWKEWTAAYLQHYFDLMGEDLFKERAGLLRKNIPEYQLSYIRCFAETMGVDEKHALYLNLLGDIARPTGCSSILHVNNNSEVLIGHHLDWPDYGVSHKLVTLTRMGSKRQVISQGFAGLLSSAVAINSNGVGVFLHDSYTKRDYDTNGKVSIGLSLTELIQESDTAWSFVEKMSTRKFTYGCMYFVVDQTHGFVVEHAIDKTVVQEIHKGEIACRSNHFLLNGINNTYDESEKRLMHLSLASDILCHKTGTESDIYEILSSEGVFRPLDSKNVQQLSSCSILSMAYNATTGRILASGISQYPALKISQPVEQFVHRLPFNGTNPKSIAQ